MPTYSFHDSTVLHLTLHKVATALILHQAVANIHPQATMDHILLQMDRFVPRHIQVSGAQSFTKYMKDAKVIRSGPDPVFGPNDPSMSSANYPQPPNSSHNQAPSPVPYGPPGGQPNSQFYMHVHPQLQNRPPPQFQLSNCKLSATRAPLTTYG